MTQIHGQLLDFINRNRTWAKTLNSNTPCSNTSSHPSCSQALPSSLLKILSNAWTLSQSHNPFLPPSVPFLVKTVRSRSNGSLAACPYFPCPSPFTRLAWQTPALEDPKYPLPLSTNPSDSTQLEKKHMVRLPFNSTWPSNLTIHHSQLSSNNFIFWAFQVPPFQWWFRILFFWDYKTFSCYYHQNCTTMDISNLPSPPLQRTRHPFLPKPSPFTHA